MLCLILAGGLGTRMRPLTAAVPKCLIPVGGRPFAHWQLELLRDEGVTDVVYAVGYLGEKIRRSVGDGSRWGVRVRCVEDGPMLAGTAGALRRAYDEGLLPPEFLIGYGDSYAPAPLDRVWRAFYASRMPALMCVMRNHRDWERGNARYEPGRPLVYDKNATHTSPRDMRFIDYGITVMRRDVIAERVAPGERADLAAAIGKLSLEGRLGGYEMNQRSYEIGSPRGLAEFQNLIAREEKLPA